MPGLLPQERLPKKIPKKAAHPIKVNEEEAPICKKQPGSAYPISWLFLRYIFPSSFSLREFSGQKHAFSKFSDTTPRLAEKYGEDYESLGRSGEDRCVMAVQPTSQRIEP